MDPIKIYYVHNINSNILFFGIIIEMPGIYNKLYKNRKIKMEFKVFTTELMFQLKILFCSIIILFLKFTNKTLIFIFAKKYVFILIIINDLLYSKSFFKL